MSKNKATQPQTSPQPGGGVDFLVRTMIERESTGKRPIRPKNVEDLLQSAMQDESDDSDFDYDSSESDGSGGSDEDDSNSSNSSSCGEDNEDGGVTKENPDSDESDDEDYQEMPEPSSCDDSEGDSGDNSENSSENSDSDESEKNTQMSALQETLRKLNNEENEFAVKSKRPAKKRRKVKPGGSGKAKKVKTSKKKSSGEPKSSKTKTKGSSNKTKVSKASLKVSASKSKKSKNVKSSKVLSEKKKKKKDKNEDSSSYKVKRRSINIGQLMQDTDANQKENRKSIDIKKPVCSACLGDKSDDINEVVECDSCGISVHESCYGLCSDNASVSSGSGSSSCTEPWFCDVCKSDSENIFCELCPVEGGLFKESTAGRWVHLVCALYTQRVVVCHDSTINLYELPYSRWGSHNCSACEDESKAQTGIAICCDAGMCKTYFHATCAQKLGLLSDPNQVDFSEADPYFVSCKLHTNRETMKRRMKLFNTLQEQLRIKSDRKDLSGLPSEGANVDHERIHRKLRKVRAKTALKRAQYLNSLENVPSVATSVDQVGLNPLNNLPASWLANGNKKQRLMHTSAKYADGFLRKMDRLGDNVVAEELEVKHEKIISNVKRKWNVLPSMGVEYAAYYADRESRIDSLLEQHNKAVKENHELMDKEIALKDVWETHAVNKMAMEEETNSVSKTIESLGNILMLIKPEDKKTLSAKLQNLYKPKELFGGRRKSPSTSRADRKSPSSRRQSVSKKSNKNRINSPSPNRSGKLAMAACHTCSKSDNQHLITRCDKCGKHYHLDCLDPPLTRMPKRSRQCGWMCSDCCDSPSEDDDQVDTEAPRTLRGRTKIHKPRKYRGSDDSGDESKSPVDTNSKPPSVKKSKSVTSSLSSPELAKLTTPTTDLTEEQRSTNKSSSVEKRRQQSGSVNINKSTPSSTFDLSTAVNELGSLLPLPVSSNVSPVKPQKTTKSPKTKSNKKSVSPDPKVSPTVKSSKEKKNNKEEVGIIKKKASLSKRKSSDGPLTVFKVNGFSETPIPDLKLEETSSKPTPLKKKRSKVKSEELATDSNLAANGHIPVNHDILNFPSVTNLKTESPTGKVKKPRSRKKKDAAEEISAELTVKEELNVVKEEKVKIKRPRKKKEKSIANESQSVDSSIQIIGESANKELDKPSKRKPKKPRTSVVNAAKVAVMDDLTKTFDQVTRGVLANKPSPTKNGIVKPKQPSTKKRKKSIGKESTSFQGESVLSSPISLPEVKEKSVPPKKRKRATTSIQGLQGVQMNNSNVNVDNIIQAVSVGENLRPELENEDLMNLIVPTNGISDLINEISPSCSLSSGHNLMQGKQMGSGVNSGEMVTVDASFLLDGPVSTQSSFTNNSAATFYTSANHSLPTGSSQDNQSSSSSTNGPSNNDNVIRLQYIDSSDSTVVVSSSATSVSKPTSVTSVVAGMNFSNSTAINGAGICALCTKSEEKGHLLKCDRCHLDFHFCCEVPSMKQTPRKKGYPWFCKNCDDGMAHENGVIRQPQ